MSDIVIGVENLTKIYPMFNNKSDRLKEALSLTRKKYHSDFYALNDINFEVKKGETLGIIGQNGSGKSTLLKILSGVLTQTSGKVEVSGKISALLELGAGFNPEMTGLENIYLNGTIMGYTREEMQGKINQIIKFADIGQFINQPVKMYSSGMFVRLAFSVAINVEPQILIVDEALAVGDMRFQQKCFREIERFRKNGTVIMVSHDLVSIAQFCKNALWINDGKIEYYGGAKSTVEKYSDYIINSLDQKPTYVEPKSNAPIQSEKNRTLIPLAENLEIAGNGEASIISSGLFDMQNNLVKTLYPDNLYKFAAKVSFKKQLSDVIFGIEVKNKLGVVIFGINSDMMGINMDPQSDVCEYGCSFVMPKLISGEYSLSAAIASGTLKMHVQHCWVHDIVIFNLISNDSHMGGMVYIDDAIFESSNK